MPISPDTCILVYACMYYKKFFFLLYFLLSTINNREPKTAFFLDDVKIAANENYKLETRAPHMGANARL